MVTIIANPTDIAFALVWFGLGAVVMWCVLTVALLRARKRLLLGQPRNKEG